MSQLVVIDPGHGGSDPGAEGNGLREATLTLTLGTHVRNALLHHFDVRVALTRTADQSVELSRRAAFANDLHADYFVAIHINSGGGTGYEDYVHRSVAAGSETAARQSAIHDAVMTVMHRNQMPDRGKKTANFAVLRETAMPAILTENLFIDTIEDARLLADDAFLVAVARAHATGIGAALALSRKAA